MEDSSWGYSEIPPGSGGNAAERERKRLAEKSERQYPPAERPLYSPLPEPEPEEEQPEQRPSGTALSLTSLVIGIVAVVLAAVFFYRSNVNIKSAEIHAQQALTAVDELKHSGSPAPAALKIELMRTTRTLDAMTVEFQGEPEALAKIEELRNEVKEILAMLDEKTPEAAPAEEQAAPAEAPAAAIPEAAVTPAAPAAKQPSPPPAK